MIQATAGVEDTIITMQEAVAGEVVATQVVAEEEEEILGAAAAEGTQEEEEVAASKRYRVVLLEIKCHDHERLSVLSAGSDIRRLSCLPHRVK